MVSYGYEYSQSTLLITMLVYKQCITDLFYSFNGQVDHKYFPPVSCRKFSDRLICPKIKTDRVEDQPSLMMRKTVDQRDATGEKLDGFNPNVTIGTMGAHYWIRILTYKNHTPLSNYLATFEVESMEVMNLTMFTSTNKVLYDIILKVSISISLCYSHYYRIRLG